MSRVNEIFSVNRLRQSWSQKDKIAGPNEKNDGVSASPDYKHAMDVFERLVFLAKAQYSEIQMIPLDLLFDNLKEKLSIRFGETENSISETMSEQLSGEQNISEPEITETDIIELLDTIEDIAEGFDCLR